jgi:hypothetical protein
MHARIREKREVAKSTFLGRGAAGDGGGVQKALDEAGVEEDKRHGRALQRLLSAQRRAALNGAAQESNLPSVGLPRLTGFEGLLRKVHLRTEAGFRPRFSPSSCSEVR